ncbi:PQ-loop repeat-containing protein 1, partial [Sarcoptes scabiei]
LIVSNKSKNIIKKSSKSKYLKYRKDDDGLERKDIYRPKRLTDFDFRYFWDWTDFLSYLECMAVFTLLAGLLFYFFIDVPWIVEGYGLVALVTESLLASPQFFRNLKVKSTEGMSKLMVLTWFLGDLYKTVYFFVREAPFQFLICGCTQITFDVLIFLQVIIYQKASYRKLSKSKKAKNYGKSLIDQHRLMKISLVVIVVIIRRLIIFGDRLLLLIRIENKAITTANSLLLN